MARPLTSDLSEIDENKIDNYIKEFEEIEDKDCIKNIALMGAYGSGKSTILIKLKSKNPSKYININMIEFSEDSSNSQKASETSGSTFSRPLNDIEYKEKVEKVEQSIIQQLIYQEPQKNIPFSKVKKENPNKENVIKNIRILMIFLLSTFLFFSFNCFNHIINFSMNVKSWLSLLPFLIIIFSGIYLISNFTYYCYRNFKISRISLSKNNTNIECEKYESVYNRFLDEILYFFKETSYDTVIFEDIDRYDDLLFFSHLRELNSLLNNSKYLNKKIKFIYAIKDDLFIKQDKHKFFDYIIPVIPVLDYTNSFDKFREYLPNKEISDNVIKILSLYVKDLRTLKNICNEYDFYKGLNNIEIYRNDNLLALLVFKNLYPFEFARLQYNESVIDIIFNKKKEIIDKIKGPKIDEIEHLTRALKDKEYCLDPELTLLGLIKNIIESNANSLKIRHGYSFTIEGITGNFSNLNDILFSHIDWNLFRNKPKSIKINSTYYGHDYLEISDLILERIDKLIELYDSQKEINIDFKNNIMNKIDKLESELSSYANIKANKLYQEKQDELEKILIDYKELNKDIIDNKFVSLVKQLILEDLINESYSSYISLTYKTNKNENDITFIRNVYSNIKNSFDLELNNIDAIYTELKNKLYDNNCIFNKYVIKYFALKDTRKLDEIMKINKSKLNAYYRILDYNDELFDIIVCSICKAEPKISYYVGKDNNNYRRNKWIKTILTLRNNTFNSLEISYIFAFIENYDLIKLSKINSNEIDNLINNSISSGIKFCNISGLEQNKELYSLIVNNKLFVFNFNNLKIINLDLNYSEMVSNNNLKEYINENIDEFLNILIENNINTLQSDGFHNFINEKLEDEELLCKYYEKNPIVIENPKIIRNEKVCLTLCKNTLNIMPFLKSLSLSKDCIINMLKSLNKNFVKENSVALYNIIYSQSLFDINLIQTNFYENLLASIDNQSDKDFIIVNLLPFLNDKNVIRIVKAYDVKFKSSKKQIIISNTEINKELSKKLEECNYYKIENTDNNYIYLKSIDKPPVLIS